MADNNENQYNHIHQQANRAVLGLNLDNIASEIPEGNWTNAMNSAVENFNGQMITIQNDTANIACITFPDGFVTVGIKNAVEISRVIYWLLNPNTGDCQIGYSNYDECIYNTLIDSSCLNFSLDYPIKKAVIKTTNCSTQVYWTDNKNPRRYLDFNNLPLTNGQVDCNKLLIQPNFSIPSTIPTLVDNGGNLVAGTYQFAVQYSNVLGEGYTQYYNITNPIGVFADVATLNFNFPTNKAISIAISGLDTSGVFPYFNLAVIKTVNSIPTYELVGTYFIDKSTFSYVYTGSDLSPTALTSTEVVELFNYYNTAEDIYVVDNVLGWANLKGPDDINYQDIWSKVHLQWITYQLPYNQAEAYYNGVNTAEYKGYLRDEVYAFEGCFILKNGMQTRSFHIPGRVANSNDFTIVNNQDAQNITNDLCHTQKSLPNWQVYNTGSLIGNVPGFNSNSDPCSVGPYEYGEMAYWESQERYPNNPTIWGSLANQQIRHHKFPDSTITHIHQGMEFVYPIGVRIDPSSLYNAVNSSSLTQQQKSDIVGFKIFRANRKGNESVTARGIFNNVGKYTKNGQSYLYPNYPYNDLRPDPFFTTQQINANSGFQAQYQLQGFQDRTSSRFTFHSPETHFGSPSLGGGYVKVETIEYGTSYSHFVQVEKNAKYQFLNENASIVALFMALVSVIDTSISVSTSTGFSSSTQLNWSNIAPTYINILDIIKKLTTSFNYGYSFNSYGVYDKYYKVPNTGNKIRAINTAKYITSGVQTGEQGSTINNIHRESSVYIHTQQDLPYCTAYSNTIPQDTSRFNMGSLGAGSTVFSTNLVSQNLADLTQIRSNPINTYYGTIKRVLEAQYGEVYSYATIDTGFYSNFDFTQSVSEFPAIFGGDTFINKFALKTKIPFFLDNTVKAPDNTDIAYDELANLGYAMYWLSTKPLPFDSAALTNITDLLTNNSGLGWFLNLLYSVVALPAAIIQCIIQLFTTFYEISNRYVNIDIPSNQGFQKTGAMYLFAYGIPNFFVESTVNVDYRQAYNDLEGNYYPRVSTNIPDEWVQEVNVSISNDNTYLYNPTYSRQNSEPIVTHLRADWTQANSCFTNYPYRTIYSEQSNTEEVRNNWLLYKPLSLYDFPKSYGQLVSLDKLENKQILARFYNKSQIYNALTTLEASQGPAVTLGNPELFFATPPIDIAETDIGYAGAQHKLLLRTEFGHVFVDARRGQIILYTNGKGGKDLADIGMDKWFSKNLPFYISNHFPQIDVDNAFNGIGLHGVYDAFYQRIILTKLDYDLVKAGVSYSNGTFYAPGGEPITLDNTDYFCNKSWTLSYSFKTNSWVSFHSFIPNFYIPHPNYFQSGINNKTITGTTIRNTKLPNIAYGSSLWNHHNTYFEFNKYYGVSYPYMIEYPFSFKEGEQILQSVREYCTAFVYQDWDIFYEPDEVVYFNKAIVYNRQQCTGTLNLVPKPTANLQAYSQYPIINSNSKDVLVAKTDHLYNFNILWDIVKDKTKSFWKNTCTPQVCSTTLDDSVLDYSNMSFKKYPLRAKDCRIRLTSDNRNDVKFINRFILTQTEDSIL